MKISPGSQEFSESSELLKMGVAWKTSHNLNSRSNFLSYCTMLQYNLFMFQSTLGKSNKFSVLEELTQIL